MKVEFLGLTKGADGCTYAELKSDEWDCSCDVNYDDGLVIVRDVAQRLFIGIPIDLSCYQSHYPYDENGGL